MRLSIATTWSKPSQRRIEHVADRERHAACAEIVAAHALAQARPASARCRSPTTSAPRSRRLDRKRAGPATGVENAARHACRGQPRQQCRAHSVAAGSHRRSHAPDRRVRSQALPGFGGCAVEIGFQLVAVWRCRSRWSSVEPQKFEEIAVLHGLRLERLEPGPKLIGEAQDIRSAPPRARASVSISNSVDFFSRLRRTTSRSRKCATRLSPTAVL